MGKTIMISALIQTLREPDSPDDAEEPVSNKNRQLKLNSAFRTVTKIKPQVYRGPDATLIVAPTSLLSQWSEELKRSSKAGTVDVLVWHGQNRLDLEAFASGDNEEDSTIKVVVTSYGVLASEHAKSEKLSGGKSPVFESVS
jgi:DNA repair protein RAD5